jgi:hypothetical protein
MAIERECRFVVYLLDYSIYIMYWSQFEMLPLGIASKLGYHPFTNAILVTVVSTSPPKQPPVGPWQLKRV